MELNTHVEPNPRFEEAITQMRQWLGTIYPASKVDRSLLVQIIPWHEMLSPRKKEAYEKLMLDARIFTGSNEYKIVGTVDYDSTYLGCMATSRKNRAGETWNRGNDLADGKFTQETWNRILMDIVRYETEEIKSEHWKHKYMKHSDCCSCSNIGS